MALKELRGAGKGILPGLFLAVLVTSFVGWGVSDIFKGREGKGVASFGGGWLGIGAQWIGAGEFQQRLQTTAERVGRQQGKPLNLEEVQALGLPARVVDQMVNERALDVSAAHLGLATHDETLSRVIRSMPAFQGPSGSFDEQTYRELLERNHLAPQSFEAEMRGDISRSQLQTAVMEGAVMPRGQLEALLAFHGEMREISYVVLDPALAGTIPPPDKATLDKLINANKDAYSTPELRSFVALMFRDEDFANRVQIADKELLEQYDFQKSAPSKPFTVPEQRVAREISFPTEADAQTAFRELQSHAKTFEEIGRARGLKDDALAFKTQARKDISDPVVVDAVYGAKGPGLIGPINGTLAWAIAEVKEIIPERTKAFDEVKDEIRKNLAKTRAQDLIYSTVNQFEDARAGGSTFEEISQKLNVPLVKFTGVDASGKDRTGKEAVTGPEAGDVLKAAFQAEVGTDSETQNLTGGGQFAVRLDNVAPPALRPFAEIEAPARAAYEAQERAKRLQAKAASLVTAHAKDGLGAVAAELGVASATLPAPLRRGGESDVLAPSLAAALFKARPQTIVAGDSATPGKMVIATVLRVDRPSPTELAQGVAALGIPVSVAKCDDFEAKDQQVPPNCLIANEVQQAYVNAVRKKLNAKTYPAAVQQATTTTRF